MNLSSTRPLRVFTIGNSFASNATQFLPELAREGGHSLEIGGARIGGCSLQKHWELVEAAELAPDLPQNKPYEGRNLREWLTQSDWDIVTLQQASIDSSCGESYDPYAQKLWDFVDELQPRAEIVWHQTWAYHAHTPLFGRVDSQNHAQNQREMWENSRAAYHAVAARTGTRIIPVGDAFWHVNSDPNWPLPDDANFHSQSAQHPDLPAQPNSLHRGVHWFLSEDGSWKLGFDGAHANEAGCYLGALIWYSWLFEASPENLTFRPQSVPADFAAYLRRVAWQVVQNGARNTQLVVF